MFRESLAGQSSEAPSSTKRKHKTLTLCDKKEIIERLEKGEKTSQLARLYGVGRSTIYDIRQNGERIIKFIDTAGPSSGKKRHTLKSGEFPEVDKALYSWYLEQRAEGRHISGENLRERANLFYRMIHKNHLFRASEGWLDKFKKRFGIRFLNYATIENVTSPEEGTTFKEKIIRKVQDMALTPDQIYTADETVLFPRTLPDKIHCAQENMTKFGNRLTLMPCANTTGTHKLRLLLVGTLGSGAVQNSSLSVVYKSQAETIISKKVITGWFNDCFIPEVQSFSKMQNKAAKALLVLNDAHHGGAEEERLKSADETIQVIFAPHYCNKHVIHQLKMYYRKSIIYSLLNQEQDVDVFLKSQNLKEVIFNLSHAWNQVTSQTIASSWRVSSENEPEELRKNSIIDVSLELVQALGKKCGVELTKEDIEDWLQGSSEEKLSTVDGILEEEESSEVVESTEVSSDDALKAVNTCVRWAEENNLSNEDRLVLKRLQEDILDKILTVKK